MGTRNTLVPPGDTSAQPLSPLATSFPIVPVDVPIRVVLADDHALLRHGMRALLDAAGNFDVIGEAGDGREAVRLAVRLTPDIVLLDVQIPGLSVQETIRQIKRAGTTRVLVLATRAEEGQLFDLLRAGASGLLLKEATGAELICALRDVHRAEFYVSSSVSRKVLNRWHRGAVTPPRRRQRSADVADPLSDRERELLDCVVAGLANRMIAVRMSISVRTVEAHKAHIVAKLELKGANDLVRWALERRGAMPSAGV